MNAIAIDLGTSNTLVAKLAPDGKPQLFQFEDNLNMIPSVIGIEEAGDNAIFGSAALGWWLDGQLAERTFRRWKLKMGENAVLAQLHMGGRLPEDITPERLTTLLVQHIVETLSAGHDGEEIDSVLVTVPHGWRRENPEKCRATREAAAAARINGKPVAVQNITVSEPVAAAAYWLWMSQQKGGESFAGKTILVCDVGGGTFDLSLVAAGGKDKPLDVIDAANNNLAGDIVDALICAVVCQEFNQKHNTSYPTDAEQILDSAAGSMPWLRSWLQTCRRNFKEGLSDNIDAHLGRGGKNLDELRPARGTFNDPENRVLNMNLTASRFQEILEPYYQDNRDFLQNFLSNSPSHLPYAVVFAGGGSRLYGICEHVVNPVLQTLMGNQAAEEALKRLPANRPGRSAAIVFGAALIANGVVSVQERLLHDVGLGVDIPHDPKTGKRIGDGELLANALNLPEDVNEILITPLLSKGSVLPCSVKSADINLPFHINAESIDFKIAVDDGSDIPWIQQWTVDGFDADLKNGIDLDAWEIKADNDGAITVSFSPKERESLTFVGRLIRQGSGRGSLVIGRASIQGKKTYRRVSPDEIRRILSRKL
ncbi:MAG: Hsp70 family protein [Desulforudis sp.]|jgi:molecular chaperone DnaK|nr:MAG: Hsp70 family protein [Desulforudis sp.]